MEVAFMILIFFFFFFLDVTNNFDYVFWCGDLNFRLSHSRSEVMKWISQHRFPLVSPIHQSLSDQLTDCILSGTTNYLKLINMFKVGLSSEQNLI